MKKDRKDNVRGTFTDETGKRHYLRAESKTELAAKIALREDAVRRGELILDPNTTVAKWVDAYCAAFIQPTVSKQWGEEIHRMLSMHLVAKIGGLKLSQVRPIHLQKIVSDAGGYSYSVQCKLVQNIKRCFRTARQNKREVNSSSLLRTTMQEALETLKFQGLSLF